MDDSQLVTYMTFKFTKFAEFSKFEFESGFPFYLDSREIVVLPAFPLSSSH